MSGRVIPRLSVLHLQSQSQPLPAPVVAPYRACERCTWSTGQDMAIVCTHPQVRGPHESVSVVLARGRQGACGPDAVHSPNDLCA